MVLRRCIDRRSNTQATNTNAAARAAELVRPFTGRGSAYQARLGEALTLLSLASSELGQPEQALDAARAAIDLYRELKEREPDTFLPDLASSLNNYARVISALGQREPALAAARESVELR